MSLLKGKTAFITGASRGIGKAIALKIASDGANIAIAAKTDTPHPKLPGTIHQTAEEVMQAGGKALPLVVDIRDEFQIHAAVKKTVEAFGGIDILVNNASAISLTGTLETASKRFDLMHQINTRGTFLCSQACIPFLKKSTNPHILNISPPLNLAEKWFKDHLAYTLSKYGMSMCVLGMAAEFEKDGIAVNALWPKTLIATSAMLALLDDPVKIENVIRQSRKPAIMADAAYVILSRPSKLASGHFFIDEEVLSSAQLTDLSCYAHEPGQVLLKDFFLE
jgi:citronellol/citronellal dehydrogenase